MIFKFIKKPTSAKLIKKAFDWQIHIFSYKTNSKKLINDLSRSLFGDFPQEWQEILYSLQGFSKKGMKGMLRVKKERREDLGAGNGKINAINQEEK